MTTDTSERGLERLICTALAGHACDPPKEGRMAEAPAGYGGVGWTGGSPDDYDREFCVDLVQLAAFLNATQPEAAESLALHENGPTRRKFLARLQGEISKRGTIDVLRHGDGVAQAAPQRQLLRVHRHPEEQDAGDLRRARPAARRRRPAPRLPQLYHEAGHPVGLHPECAGALHAGGQLLPARQDGGGRPGVRRQ